MRKLENSTTGIMTVFPLLHLHLIYIGAWKRSLMEDEEHQFTHQIGICGVSFSYSLQFCIGFP